MVHEIIIRILIADDHPMMREGLRSTLEIERDMKIVGEVSDGAEAVESFVKLRPDVVLMDLQMPRFDGAYSLEDIRCASPDTPSAAGGIFRLTLWQGRRPIAGGSY